MINLEVIRVLKIVGWSSIRSLEIRNDFFYSIFQAFNDTQNSDFSLNQTLNFNSITYYNNQYKPHKHTHKSSLMTPNPLKIIILLTVLTSLTQSWFVPDRLSIIDQNKKNFIIRGNLPMKQKQFQMDELKVALENVTKLPHNSYELVVVSLMNGLTPKEAKNMYIQEKFFDQHKEYTYVNNVVLGSFIDPKSLPKFLRDLIVPMYETLSIDGMDNLLSLTRGYLQSKKPTIVYIHCSQGVDRTGYVHAAYSMKYYNTSLEQAYRYNLQVLKNMRNRMHFNTYFGIEWYCLYLGRSEGECLKGLQD